MKIKADHYLVIIVIAFFGGFILRGLIEGDQLPITEIITGIVTLIAAYAGASFAFRLQHDKEEKEKIVKEVASANRAIYTLLDIWNVQKQYQEEIIKPFRGRDDAWLNMSPTIPGVHEIIEFNIENLDFLLSSGKPEVYTELLLEEKRYRIAIAVIEERSKLFFDKVYPKIESFGIRKGDKVDQDILENGLGPDLTNRLKNMTNAIISNIDENVVSLVSLHEKARNYFKEIYPDERFIAVSFNKSVA